MISGFNTDVLHRDTVYHVQTEDKGRGNPVIESLVFVGGRVVVSKRDDYSEMVEEGAEDQAIAERMDRQHRTMIAAIRSGRFEEQIEAVLESGAEAFRSGREPRREGAAGDSGRREPGAPGEAAGGRARSDRAAEIGRRLDDEPRLDEMVLRYLREEASREHLVLALEENGDLEVGRKAFLALRASSSRTGAAVQGATITVRMISTLREPELLAEGVTDPDGECFLNVQVPALGTGSAALIISASSDIGSAELKQLL